jgi:hypothetical protein
MPDIWPKNDSATGRGFTQGSDSYRADDVARMEREQMRADAIKAGCTCWNSSFGMDVDRCPVHGQGCA